MKESDSRAETLGKYIIETGATVRAAAKVFKISKSTVQMIVTYLRDSTGRWHK